MAELVEPSSGTMMTMIDEIYEFSAPRFFDFVNGETDEDASKAELWFHSALAYAPSPFMPKIKADRSVKVEALCDFSEADTMQKASESSSSSEPTNGSSESDMKKEEATISLSENKDENTTSLVKDCSTPRTLSTDSKKMASSLKKPSAMKPRAQVLQSSSQAKVKTSKLASSSSKSTAGTPGLAQENQAIKRQKLDGGRSRQILNVKPQNLLHKSKLGQSSSSNLCSITSKQTSKESRKVYVREPAAAPFVSMAEMMKKFQSSTRDLSLPKPLSQVKKPKLTLTRPKEPDFETSQRIRSIKVKSSAELEEEMMAKIPKFKARPVNKKILEATNLPALPRTAPQPPQFQEFHFQTVERANQNAESASVASTEKSHQHNQWKPCLTDPKTPVLHTSLRARPLNLKSSMELELEELEKVPKFRAKPLNKKILESKGGMGVFCIERKQVTKPQEFHFATNERIPLPAPTVTDLFDKLSMNSEPYHANKIPRNTRPNPFHLQTEERGAEKERRFCTEVMQKQWEEEQARVPKANPYPYTTDYPVIPPKPEPKEHTKPEPFQLESLVRHEEEVQREMEERRRMEKEEAQRRMFKAQPVLKEDPIPVPEKVRRPLTQVEDFNLHIDHRAKNRAEFDKKIKEKEMMYKRYREESEAARMMEDEKELKQLRRSLVPHARPMPKFSQPFLPQKSSKEATKPKAPKLEVLERRERRKFISMR